MTRIFPELFSNKAMCSRVISKQTEDYRRQTGGAALWQLLQIDCVEMTAFI